ncbi:hypothetical protein R1flu_017294, partial [Riccia fluitans]
ARSPVGLVSKLVERHNNVRESCPSTIKRNPESARKLEISVAVVSLFEEPQSVLLDKGHGDTGR